MENIDIWALAGLGAGIVFIVILAILQRKKVDFGILTLVALGFGVVTGVVFLGHTEYVAVIGKIYVRLISALVIPLLFFSIISSVSSLENLQKLKSIGAKSFGWLTFNTLTASLITLGLALAAGIGRGGAIQLPTDYVPKEVPTVVDTITNLFPNNVIANAANGEVVPFILFALLLGVALVVLAARKPEAAQPFKKFIDSGAQLMFTAVEFIVMLTPYAVLALIAGAIGKAGVASLLPLIGVLVVAYVVCLLQSFVVSGLALRIVAKLNPLKFFAKVWPAQVVAFTSQSSVGTIPVTERQLSTAMGVKPEVAGFVSALGANVGMPGCAGMWPTLLAVFAIHALDIPFSPVQYVFLIVLTVLVSIGTVGVPGTATITATAVFAAAGLPIEVIVIMAPISSIVDMARTATNVTGAAMAAVLVAKSENALDVEAYNSKTKKVAPEQA